MLRFDPAPRLQHGSNFWRPSRQSRQQSGLKWLRVSMLKLFVRRTCVFVVGAICWWQSKARVPIFKEWDFWCYFPQRPVYREISETQLFICMQRKKVTLCALWLFSNAWKSRMVCSTLELWFRALPLNHSQQYHRSGFWLLHFFLKYNSAHP